MLAIRLALATFILLPCFSAAYDEYDDDEVCDKDCKQHKGASSSQCGSKCGCCTPVVPGPQGSKGDQGVQGPQGPQGPPGALAGPWKQCTRNNLNNGNDFGLLMACAFNKKSSQTALRVTWTGVLRIRNCNSCCKRWYFTFNGTECTDPDPIDGIVYMYRGAAVERHKNVLRVRTIVGACEGISAGAVSVGFEVGNCASWGGGDAYTGWNSVSRIMVEEVPPPQK